MKMRYNPEVNLGHVLLIVVWISYAIWNTAMIKTDIDALKTKVHDTESIVSKISDTVRNVSETQIRLTTIIEERTK